MNFIVTSFAAALYVLSAALERRLEISMHRLTVIVFDYVVTEQYVCTLRDRQTDRNRDKETETDRQTETGRQRQRQRE